MPKNLLSHLTKSQINELFEALNFMNMLEIKDFCSKHHIAPTGKKGHILERVQHYLKTGTIPSPKKIPDISKAEPNKKYPLAPNTRILYGSYKNDAKTRQFFKKIIGEHFHFTAFGQDWLLHRWQQGKPPTYGEFAKLWQKEYSRRKDSKAKPKKEWAYLNFMQRIMEQYPNKSKKDIALAWEKERHTQVKKAINLLNKIEVEKSNNE